MLASSSLPSWLYFGHSFRAILPLWSNSNTELRNLSELVPGLIHINLQYTAQWDTSDSCIVVRGTTAYSEELVYLYCQSRHMLSPA